MLDMKGKIALVAGAGSVAPGWGNRKATAVNTDKCRTLCGVMFALCLLLLAPSTHAAESVVVVSADDGTRLSYLLVTKSAAPKYLIIGFPGGSGIFNAREENGKILFAFGGNFVVRTRDLTVDDEFAMALTDSTSLTERMIKIVNDLKQRFPDAQIYIMSTSNGTIDSANLSLSLGNQVSGAIHTASMAKITAMPFNKSVMRQLLVHHINDGCHATNYGGARYVSEKYGIKLITMTGGIGQGDPCEAFGHHGFAGVEKETIDAIKQWIKQE